MKRNDMNIVDLSVNLESTEQYLRNRRMFVEAESVKLAREIILSVALEYHEKESMGKESQSGKEKEE